VNNSQHYQHTIKKQNITNDKDFKAFLIFYQHLRIKLWITIKHSQIGINTKNTGALKFFNYKINPHPKQS